MHVFNAIFRRNPRKSVGGGIVKPMRFASIIIAVVIACATPNAFATDISIGGGTVVTPPVVKGCTSRPRCPAGQQPTSDWCDCEACPAGTYSAASDTADCTACPEGFRDGTTTGATSASSCLAKVAAGKKLVTTGLCDANGVTPAEQVQCDTGTYSTAKTAYQPDICYANVGVEITSCSTCTNKPANSYYTRYGTSSLCPWACNSASKGTGAYSATVTTGSNSCTYSGTCNANYYKPTASGSTINCTPCPTGQHASAGNTATSCTANTYTVVYNLNGGSGTAPSNITCTYGTSCALNAGTGTTFYRAGYKLIGWSTSSTATTGSFSTSGATTTNGGTAVLYAVWSPCVAGTYKASGVAPANECTACSGRAQYQNLTGQSTYKSVDTGFYTTGCDASGNGCTGQAQCTGATYCTGGVQYSCPATTSGWTRATGTGWTAATSCYQYRTPANCASGTVRQYGVSDTVWGVPRVYSTLTAQAGYYSSGPLCLACPTSYPNSAAGSTSPNDCYLTTSAGKYVKTAGSPQENCPAGSYCPGGTNVYFSPYVFVDYITTSNDASINTQLPLSRTGYKVKAKMQPTSTSNIFGAYYGQINGVFQRYYASMVSTVFQLAWFNQYPSWNSSIFVDGSTHEYDVVFTNGRQTLSKDGALVASAGATVSASGVATSYNYTLPALRNGTAYHMQWWDASTDALLRNFLPAYDPSTGKYGMYDTVTNAFFGNGKLDASVNASATGGDKPSSGDGVITGPDPDSVTSNTPATGGSTVCSGRTQYQNLTGQSTYKSVTAGFYTTGCDASGNGCTGQLQCTGATYCTGGVQSSCPDEYDYNTENGKVSQYQCQTLCAEGTRVTQPRKQCSSLASSENVNSTYAFVYSGTNNWMTLDNVVNYGHISPVVYCPIGYDKYSDNESSTNGHTGDFNNCVAENVTGGYAIDNWSSGMPVRYIKFSKTSPNSATSFSSIQAFDTNVDIGEMIEMSGADALQYSVLLDRPATAVIGTVTNPLVATGSDNMIQKYTTMTGSMVYDLGTVRDLAMLRFSVWVSFSFYGAQNLQIEVSIDNENWTTVWGPATIQYMYRYTGIEQPYITILLPTLDDGKYECSAGTYATAGDVNYAFGRSCTPASMGYYVDKPAATSQTACAIGSYTDETGRSDCTACGDGGDWGKTTTGVGQTSCNANCSNNDGVHGWATASWNTNNTVTDLCTPNSCNGGYYMDTESKTCPSCDDFAGGMYPFSAASGTTKGPEACYAYRRDGYYVAHAKDDEWTPCQAGYFYKNKQNVANPEIMNEVVHYGETYDCKPCADNTYSADGASACTACLDNYTTYGPKTGPDACRILCRGGTYLATANATECTQVGAGYWAPETWTIQGSTGTRNACVKGTTVGYGRGADEAADCGPILHVGDAKLYLRNVKKTGPSLAFGVGDKVYYANMSTELKNMSDNVDKLLKINYNGTIYSVYDDSGEFYFGADAGVITISPNLVATSILPTSVNESAGTDVWTATLSDGTYIQGEAMCDTATATNGDVSANGFAPTGEGAGCWCRLYEPADGARWVFASSLGTTCADKCAYICANNMRGTSAKNITYRTNLYGTAGIATE